MAISHDSFEWIGGRWKLADYEPVSLLKEDIVVGETYKRMKQERLRASQEYQRRKEREWQEQQKQRLKNFLQKHNFHPKDVNAIGEKKTSCFGLMISYQRPLHKAIEDKEFAIILLLLQYGADPMLKDSKGKTAYDHIWSSMVKTRIQTFHTRVCTHGALSL